MHCTANLFPVGEDVHSPKPICSETVRTSPAMSGLGRSPLLRSWLSFPKRLSPSDSVQAPIEDTERVQDQDDVTRQPREWKGQ